MRRPCYIVDSFAAHALAGNPAGVVLDGADLDAQTMQRISNELKHSETAFPLPAREPTAALHLRWFTPEAEVAFCGHATLATFHVLVEEARRIRVPEGRLTRMAFTCKSGRLNVELSRADFESLLRRHFDEVELYGQRRLQTGRHRLVQRLDVLGLRKRLGVLRRAWRLLGTPPMAEVGLDGIAIERGRLEGATELVAVCRAPRR